MENPVLFHWTLLLKLSSGNFRNNILLRNKYLICYQILLLTFWQTALPFKHQAKLVADDIFKYCFLLLRENKSWHFMRIVCKTDDSHEIPRLIFFEKKKQNNNNKKQEETHTYTHTHTHTHTNNNNKKQQQNNTPAKQQQKKKTKTTTTTTTKKTTTKKKKKKKKTKTKNKQIFENVVRCCCN